MNTEAQTSRVARLVRVTEICFIDERLRQPGDVVETCVPITPDGPFVDANQEIAPARPKKSTKPTKSGKGDAGVPAPSWTTQGHREAHGIDGPIGMQPAGKSAEGIQISPP